MKNPGKILKLILCIIAMLTFFVFSSFAADHKEAYKKYLQGNYDGAIADFKAIQEVSPEWYFPHLMLGRCYVKKGQYSQAMVSLDMALEYATEAKNKYEIWGIKGEALYDQEKYSDVISSMDAMREFAISPDQKFNMYKLKGLAYLKMNKTDEAIREFNQALNFNAQDFDCNFEVGKANFMARNDAKAVEHLEKALAINPNRSGAYAYLMDAYYRQNQYDKMAQVGERGVLKNPQHMGIRYRLGKAYLAEKRFDDALEILDTVIDIDPSNGYARFNRGKAHFAKGNWERAINDFTETAGLLQERDDVFRFLGDSYLKLKMAEDAKMAYERAYQINASEKNQANLDAIIKYQAEHEAEMQAREEAAREEAALAEEGVEFVDELEEATEETEEPQ
jgi:tetratricopeptide (TPR) repeat protein